MCFHACSARVRVPDSAAGCVWGRYAEIVNGGGGGGARGGGVSDLGFGAATEPAGYRGSARPSGLHPPLGPRRVPLISSSYLLPLRLRVLPPVLPVLFRRLRHLARRLTPCVRRAAATFRRTARTEMPMRERTGLFRNGPARTRAPAGTPRDGRRTPAVLLGVPEI